MTEITQFTKAQYKGQPVVIIVTYGRSGSTLLSKIVSSFDGYHMAGENRDALWGIYISCEALLKAQKRSKLLKTGLHEPWYMIDRIDVKTYARKMLGAFFEEVVQIPNTARVIGFKEIRFLEHGEEFDPYLNFLLDHIDNVRFIFNKRNHEEVAASGWYKKMDKEKVIKKLEEYDSRMERFALQHPAKAIMCNYNEYTANPLVLKDMHDFMGETFDVEKVKQILAVRLEHGQKARKRN